MKKPFICFITAAIVVSCSNNAEKSATGETQPSASTTNELQLKEQNEGIERAKEAILDSINLAHVKQRTIDSMNAAAASQAIETHGGTRHLAHHTPAPVRVAEPLPAPDAPADAPPQAVTSDNPAPTATTAAEPEKKKGLNNAARGGLIGLGTGVAAGAILDRNSRGQGAVLGGIIGAVGGAISGAVIDKHKKKKAEQDSLNKAK